MALMLRGVGNTAYRWARYEIMCLKCGAKAIRAAFHPQVGGSIDGHCSCTGWRGKIALVFLEEEP